MFFFNRGLFVTAGVRQGAVAAREPADALAACAPPVGNLTLFGVTSDPFQKDRALLSSHAAPAQEEEVSSKMAEEPKADGSTSSPLPPPPAPPPPGWQTCYTNSSAEERREPAMEEEEDHTYELLLTAQTKTSAPPPEPRPGKRTCAPPPARPLLFVLRPAVIFPGRLPALPSPHSALSVQVRAPPHTPPTASYLR